jgi:hypothetical protein
MNRNICFYKAMNESFGLRYKRNDKCFKPFGNHFASTMSLHCALDLAFSSKYANIGAVFRIKRSMLDVRILT